MIAKFILLFLILTELLIAGDLQNGISLLKDKKYKAAEKEFQSILSDNDTSAVANYYLARIKYIQKDFDAASDYAERAVELNPKKANYHFWYANALGAVARNANVFKQAWLAPKILDQFKKTIELDSTHIAGHIGAGNFYVMAPGIMGGDIDKARVEAQTLIRLGSDRGRWLLLAIAQKEGDFEQADKQYDVLDKSFNDSTDNPGFYNNYGYYLLKRKNPNKAIKMFKRLVQLSPQDANSYDSLGDGFRAVGQPDSALVAYKKALNIDPDFKASKKKLAEIQSKK